MHKLSFIVFLMICSIHSKAQPLKHVYLLANKADTARLTAITSGDTTDISIIINAVNTATLTNHFALLNNTHSKTKPYLFLEKGHDEKYYSKALRDASFFNAKKKNKSTLMAAMIEWSNAFILNGTGRYLCLTTYKLQKNSSGGIVKMTHAKGFGPLSLKGACEDIGTEFASSWSVSAT